MDTISLSAKTTRCAIQVEGGSAKSGCREDLAEPEKELSSADAFAHIPTMSVLIAYLS